jgi:hypothetical protein
MSRRNVLTPTGKSRHVCELCGEEILHDVVRVDGGSIYHMRCFNRHVGDGKDQLRECPTCQTLGALWSWDHSQWKECDVCKGTGYLAGPGSARGSGGQGPEPLTAC